MISDLTEPLKVFLARIKAILRRNGQMPGDKEITDNIKYKCLEVEINIRKVFIDGKQVKLTSNEYDLSKYRNLQAA